MRFETADFAQRETRVRTVLVDPSLFTIPYDAALAQGLSDAGAEVHLFGREPGADEVWPLADVPLHPLFYRGLQRADRLPKRLRLPLKGALHAVDTARFIGAMRRLKPSVIHYQWSVLPMVDRLAFPALRRIAPLVLTVHDTAPFNNNPSSGLQTLLTDKAYRSFDRVIVHTPAGRQRLIGMGLDPSRVAVIEHGLLTPVAVPPDAPSRSAATPVTFLLFGKMKPYKGADVFIEAIAKIPEEIRARCRFIVAGKPYMDTAPLRALVEQRGLRDAVALDLRHFPEAEMQSLLAQADVLVFPYREIEASGVLLSSLPLGKAIVASGIGGFRDMLAEGEAALLVPVDDSEALSRALTRVASDQDLRSRLGDNARRRAAAIPDWATIARKTEDLYADAIAAWNDARPHGDPARRGVPDLRSFASKQDS